MVDVLFLTQRDKLWDKNAYRSCNVRLDSEGEDEEDLSQSQEEEEDNRSQRKSLKYVIGDVTHPVDNDRDHNIIVHCAGELIQRYHYK